MPTTFASGSGSREGNQAAEWPGPVHELRADELDQLPSWLSLVVQYEILLRNLELWLESHKNARAPAFLSLDRARAGHSQVPR